MSKPSKPDCEELEAREVCFTFLGSAALPAPFTISADAALGLGKVARAWQKWADVCNLSPTLPAPGDRADIHAGLRELPGSIVGLSFHPAGKIGGLTVDTSYTGDRFHVLLHEMGHVMGLGHSQTTASVMFPTVTPNRAPTADDIAGVRRLYGVRPHDIHDQEARNHLRLNATDLDSFFQGSSSTRQLANLRGAPDKDWYQVHATSTSMEVSVSTRGHSLLAPRLKVVNADGFVLADSSAAWGRDVSVQVATVPGQTYHILVDERPGTPFRLGTYELGVSFGATHQ